MKKTALLFVGLMLTMLTLSYSVTHVVYETMVPNPGRFVRCMEANGWDGSGECSAHTDGCGDCYNCCGDGYICNGSGGDTARAEWQTCISFCGIDHSNCDPAPDNPPDGGQNSGGGSDS